MKALLVFVVLFAVVGTITAAYPGNCFFSVAKKNGVWWFIDPTGAPFISKGVTCVTPYGDTDKNGSTDFKAAVISKYGTDYNKWAVDTAAQIKSWGMNTFGAWANSVVYNQSLAYTMVLNFASKWRTASGTTMMFPDVFDDGFTTLAQSITSTLSAQINDPYLLGYFLDNELYWGDDWRGQYSIMSVYLNQTASMPGFTKAVSFLKGKYSNIGALNSAWGIDAGSFENLKAKWPYKTGNAKYIADAAEFLGLVADQYFKVAVTAIRNVDPNHLVLGVKHVGLPKIPVMIAEGKWGDVFSFDYYNPILGLDTLQTAFSYTGLPSLVAEFAFKANDSGLPNTFGASTPVATQADRASSFETFAKGAIASPYLIGLHWFQWFDQPALGRAQDGENSNFGLVSNKNAVYTVLTNKMKDVFPKLDALHGTVPATSTSSALCYAPLTCPNGCNGNGFCNSKTGQCTCNSYYTGLACDQYIGSFTDTLTSFGSEHWYNQSGFNDSALYMNSRILSVSANGIMIPVSNDGCPSKCSGQRAISSGLTSVQSFQYGRFDFNLKINGKVPFAFTITWQSSSFGKGDGLQIAINGSTGYLGIHRWKNSADYTYTSVKLPFDPTTAYHTYSLVKYKPASGSTAQYLIYVDSTLLSTITTVVPVAAGLIQLRYSASSLPTPFLTNTVIKSVAYSTGQSNVVANCAGNYIGCYVDQDSPRSMSLLFTSSFETTVQKCQYSCAVRGYSYAGLQYGRECYCGNSYTNTKASETDCSTPCAGNTAQMCGNGYRLSIYNAGPVGYQGCYVDNNAATRDLPFKALSRDTMTIDMCRQTCAFQNFKYAGLQYGQECFCGNTFGSLGRAPEAECNLACAGDSREKCGAANRNNVYTSMATAAYPGY